MSDAKHLPAKVHAAREIILNRTQNPSVSETDRESNTLCKAVVSLREIALNSENLPPYLRDQIIQSLKGLLSSVSNQVLLAASFLLGDMKAAEAIPALMELLKPNAEKDLKISFWADPLGSYEESVQEIGCEALARMNARVAIPEIEKLLLEPDGQVRECAAKALRVLRSSGHC